MTGKTATAPPPATALRDGAGAALPHGGRLGEARAEFPGAPEPWLDLSTGINPQAYPLPGLSPDCFTRLPEPEQVEALQQAAATAFGLGARAGVAAAPGTQALIELIPRLVPAAAVAVLGPTYGEYAGAWRRAGHLVAEVASPAALAEAEIAVVCNPNNPDGRRLGRGELLALAGRLARRGGLLVVDEAFADLEDEAGLGAALPLAGPGVLGGLLLLRSFGKSYGLAGLRLGFALAAPEAAARLRAALGPWAVSGPALAIGTAALGDRAWLEATKVRLARDTRRLDALLIGAGLTVLGGTRLFRLAAGPRAPGLRHRLGQAGIWVRRFPAAPDRLRFGLPGTEADWARLAGALS